MIEIFKTCIDHDKDYMVSNMGNILSFKRYKCGKLMIGVNSNGYRDVRFSKNNKETHNYVHTLVMYYFYGPRPDGLVIDHINRIRHDNRISNLRYCTYTENNRNVKKFRYDILEKDSKKRKKILKKEFSKNRKKKLCFCGSQRRIGINSITNSKKYKVFLNHLKTKRHRNFMKSFLIN